MTSKIKNTGILRKVDNLGRVVLPKELRDTLGMEINTPVEIFVDDTAGAVCVQVYNMQKCAICNDDDESILTKVMGKHLCNDCIRKAVAFRKDKPL